MEVRKSRSRLCSHRIGATLEETKWEFRVILETHPQNNRKNKLQKIKVYLMNLLKIRVAAKFPRSINSPKKQKKYSKSISSVI